MVDEDGTQGLYALVVNNIVMPFDVTSPETTTPRIDVINVSHINGVTPGCWELTQLDPYPGSGMRDRFIGYTVRRDGKWVPTRYFGCFPTGTTMYAPRGWKYRVDSFVMDSNAVRTPQGSEVVDLTSP